MIRKFYLIIVTLSFFYSGSNLCAQDVAQMNANNQGVSYDQAIDSYRKLDEKYPQAKMLEEGPTDCGRNLNLFVISNDQTFDAASARKKHKIILLINNGIHPGEPDGIDASIRLAEDYLSGKLKLPDNIVVCIIPVYNIDGALRRGCCSRVNQNGPEQYGFRGNARNLDLNRDFIKAEASNTQSFIKIFREWDPDVFIDTHVSDGADYPYIMTLISTQHDKLGGETGQFLKTKMTPALFDAMAKEGNEMSPYVNTLNYDDSPEKGIYGFLESPRFGSGYAALFNCLSFVSETHMLKPYDKRVNATFILLKNMITFSSAHANEIISARAEDRKAQITATSFPLNWKADTTSFETINFKGYDGEIRKSKVTGMDQIYYNRDKPYNRQIRFYDHYTPEKIISKPAYYLLPQAWQEVVTRMKLNKVVMTRLERDTTLFVQTYRLTDFKTANEPYEGHYIHSEIKPEDLLTPMTYYKGDYLIQMNQDCNRYIMETLEPACNDSWFAWGFFDGILQQKEWFSAYVFDPIAEKILADDAQLKERFEKQKTDDKDFAANHFAQLYYIYRNSKYYEPGNHRYPVGRIN